MKYIAIKHMQHNYDFHLKGLAEHSRVVEVYGDSDLLWVYFHGHYTSSRPRHQPSNHIAELVTNVMHCSFSQRKAFFNSFTLILKLLDNNQEKLIKLEQPTFLIHKSNPKPTLLKNQGVYTQV